MPALQAKVRGRGAALSSRGREWQSRPMTSQPPCYRGHRFPSDIISHAVWLYYRFGLSVRDVEELLAERGITMTHEAIPQWCLTFGLDYARRLRGLRGRLVTDKLRSGAPHRDAVHDSQYPAVRKQSSRGLPPTDMAARAPDTPLQVRCPCATLSLRARRRAESVSCRPPSAPSCSPPVAQNSLVPRLGCGDVCLLSGEDN